MRERRGISDAQCSDMSRIGADMQEQAQLVWRSLGSTRSELSGSEVRLP